MSAKESGGRAPHPNRRQGSVADEDHRSGIQSDTDSRQNGALTPREFTALWLEQHAKAARNPPELGSTEFIRLLDTDPRKLAAVFKAAASWWRYTDPDVIRDDLTFELEELAALRTAHVDAEAAKTIRMLNRRPTRAEAEHRRREAKRQIPNEPWSNEQLGLESS